MASAFDLIIFDCDGVLVDSEILSCQAMRSVFEAAGIAVPSGSIERFIGMKLADIVRLLEEDLGRKLPAESFERFWPVTRALFGAELQPTPGMRAFLAASAVPRCVASSSAHERIRFSLDATKLRGFFAEDAIFSSSDVAHGKPAPDLVLHAAARMGAEPERCLVVEDSRYGIMGAVTAGMTAFGYLGGAHLTGGSDERLRDAGAAFIARHWSEIAERIGEEPAARDAPLR